MEPEVLMNVTVVAMLLVILYRRAWRSPGGVALIVITAVTAVTCLPISAIPGVLLPRWLAIALRHDNLPLRSSNIQWTSRGDGIETSDLEIFSEDYLVERIRLVRIDPALYKFSVHYSKVSPLLAEEWRERLDATVVVNGSYYLPNLDADTPLWTAGMRYGPRTYSAQHGAFVADDPPRIVDLLNRDIETELRGVKDAMVSYPLLLDAGGNVRAHGRPDWVANRTFVATDRNGRIILGTTEQGFFALKAFGNFLKNSDLQLTTALNFDGGPVACQSIRIGNFRRDVYGQWELQHHHTFARLIHQLLSSYQYGPIRRSAWKLPVVLAVQKRSDDSRNKIALER